MNFKLTLTKKIGLIIALIYAIYAIVVFLKFHEMPNAILLKAALPGILAILPIDNMDGNTVSELSFINYVTILFINILLYTFIGLVLGKIIEKIWSKAPMLANKKLFNKKIKLLVLISLISLIACATIFQISKETLYRSTFTKQPACPEVHLNYHKFNLYLSSYRPLSEISDNLESYSSEVCPTSVWFYVFKDIFTLSLCLIIILFYVKSVIDINKKFVRKRSKMVRYTFYLFSIIAFWLINVLLQIASIMLL